MSLDVEHTNFLLRYLGEIIAGLIALLLLALKLLGQRTQAQTIETNLSTAPVTKVEMLECQMHVTTTVRAELDKLRDEIRADLNRLHHRIDEIGN